MTTEQVHFLCQCCTKPFEFILQIENSKSETIKQQMTEPHKFACDCCQELYKCINCEIGETCKGKQGNDCAACVRFQQDWGPDYFGALDGPPRNDIIAAGQHYIQGFYGSTYDSAYLKFNVENVRECFPWIKEKGVSDICDKCIANMLRKKQLCIARNDDCLVYPCYCDICDKLYEKDITITKKVGFVDVHTDKSKCNTSVYKNRDAEWVFSKSWDNNLIFPSLDFSLKCLKEGGRVCDSCFSLFETKYGNSKKVENLY